MCVRIALITPEPHEVRSLQAAKPRPLPLDLVEIDHSAKDYRTFKQQLLKPTQKITRVREAGISGPSCYPFSSIRSLCILPLDQAFG